MTGAAESVGVMVMGPAGGGKSTLCNTLVGCGPDDEMVFHESPRSALPTEQTATHHGKFDQHMMFVADAPGIFDGNATNADHLVNMAEVLNSNRTIRAFLIVLNFHCTRFTEAEGRIFELIARTYQGAPWYRHIAIVWTKYWEWMPEDIKAESAYRRDAFRLAMNQLFGDFEGSRELADVPHFFVDSIAARRPQNDSHAELEQLVAWSSRLRPICEDLPPMRVPLGDPVIEKRQAVALGPTERCEWREPRRFFGLKVGTVTYSRLEQEQKTFYKERTVQPMSDGTTEYGEWKVVRTDTRLDVMYDNWKGIKRL